MRRPKIQIIVLSVLLLGCRKQGLQGPVAQQWQDQRHTTIEYFQRMISTQSEPKDDFEKYRDMQWRNAIALLDQMPDQRSERFPYLVMVVWGPSSERSDSVSLVWLEPGFEVNGVILADANGTLGEFACIRPYSSSEKKEYSSTLVRTANINVAYAADALSGTPSKSPFSIRLPRSVDWPTLRVQLRRANGAPSESMAAFLLGKK